MKKYISIFCSFLLSIQLNAQSVSFTTAYKRAENFLRKEVVESTPQKSTRSRGLSKKHSTPEYYIFNATDGNGFVIISGDDKLPSIVGYSYDDAFNAENMHPSLSAFLESYSSYVDDVRSGNVVAPIVNTDESENVVSSDESKKKKYVKPLCTSKWGQYEPYNGYCPEVKGEKCPVGCVATAMEQIMYYHKWPQRGIGSAAYYTGIEGWEQLSSSFSEHSYQWDVMKDLTYENKRDETAAEEVAKLSSDCGIATEMIYSPEGSGSKMQYAMYALCTYFGYKASTIHCEYRDCFYNQYEWNELVMAELNNNRPVMYSGCHDQKDAGHAFIVDGYNSKGLFHVNWGWDGKSNGYYALNTFYYAYSASMVCGIEPDFIGDSKKTPHLRLYFHDAPTVEVEDSIVLGESFYVYLGHSGSYRNYSKFDRIWTLATALYDIDGKQLKILSSIKEPSYTQVIMSWESGTVYAIKTKLPSSLKDGFYYIRCVARQQDYDEFILPDMEGGSYLNAIPVKVKDGVAYFGEEALSIANVQVNAVSKEYFTLSGVKLVAPENHGMVIERSKYSDGSIKTRKVFK